MKLVNELDNHFYPSASVHSQQIEQYFSINQITSDSPKQDDFLKKIEITFICFINRSGSNLFTELLSNYGYPTVKFGEPFNYEEVIETAKESGINSFQEYLYEMIKENSINNKLALKIAVNQLFWLSKNGFLSKFSRLNFIYFRRKNLLKQAISFAVASQTSNWLSFEKVEISNAQQKELLSKITNQDIINCLRGITESYSLFDYFFSLHNIQPLIVYYEDIIDQEEKVIECCLHYLNMPYYPNSIEHKLINSQYTDLNLKLEMRFIKDLELFKEEEKL